MRRQVLVIGLGQFGMSLARSLASHDIEVLAVDRREVRVQAASAFVSEAVVADVQDELALQRLAPQRRDIAVVAIGDDAREGSIMVTALLRQMGAPRIVARATDDLHERILTLVGAHEVVNPERAFGERLATRLAYRGILEELPLGPDLVLTELRTPPSFVGRTLVDLALPARFNVMVVAIRRTSDGVGRVMPASAREPLRSDDILLVAAAPDAVHALTEKV